ncbi:MAG: AMP-binding protein, partial [Chloroflexota bacterium]|nr:AMP-binding protein [Chloroflexota bacterium]
MGDLIHDVVGVKSTFWPDRLADLWPDRTAIVDPDHDMRYSYADLRRRALQVAAGLVGVGVRRGDRVTALMHSGIEMVDLFFACGRLGAILVPLNWRLSATELSHMLEDTSPALILAHQEHASLAAAAHSGTGSARANTSLMLFSDLPDEAAELPVAETFRFGVMSDPWLILYTGGTTGTPKGAVLTHGSITWNAVNTIVSWGLSERDSGPSFTPMFHTGGWNVFTLPLLMLGGTVILPERFDPVQALEILVREKPTVLFMVPTMFQMVAEQPGFESADLSRLRWVISGGAPLPGVVRQLWEPKVRSFKQGYGLTEVGPNNFATPDDQTPPVSGAVGREGGHLPMTVGKLTLFASARIVDDSGNEVADGMPG